MNNNKMSRADWQKLPAFLVRHGLFAIFYQTISDSKKIKKLYFANLRKNLLLEKELAKILSFLRKNKIDVIPLKGPIFARQIYNDLALRQAPVDFDFLIKKEDVEKIIEKLNSWSYKLHSANKYPLDFVLQNRFEILLQKPKATNLDLHWQARNDDLVPEYTTHLWQKAKKGKLANEEVLLFLSQACAPDYESDFFPFRFLFDIRVLTQNKKINFSQIVKTAEKYELKNVLFYALKLSKIYFNADIPEEVFKKTRPTFFKRKFLEIWIDEKKILKWQKRNIDNYRLWYYIGINWLFSENFINAIPKIGRKLKRRIK